MEKMICLLLAFVFALSLCACGESEKTPPKPEGLQAGFAQIKLTPESGTPMGGYGNSLKKLSTNLSHYLYAICLALSDGTDTVLLISLDLGSSSEDLLVPVRQKISQATGIPEKQIILCATHTHSAPDLEVADQNPQAAKALQQWIDGCAQIAQEAIADMAPAKIAGTTVETDGLAFVRHYKMKDGTYAGPNFGVWEVGIEDYAMESDEQMVMAKFDREGDKADILMMNFQAHATFTGGMELTLISSDCVGVTRDYVKDKTGMEVIYFTGDAGNQNNRSNILEDATGDDINAWAARLGDYAIGALDSMEDLSGDDIRISHKTQTCNVWKITDPETIAKAREVQQLFADTDRDTGNTLARKYGFSSVYHAGAVIGHLDMDPTEELELNAISVGELALVTAPYEMFSREGNKIKAESPFAVTAILGYAGPHMGYIPSQEAYDYGCYESQTALFEAGTAEILAQQYVDMLSSLK